MSRPWIGSARFLFIPLVVEGRPGYDPPPAGYQEFVRRRVYFDPDPTTGQDRSLMSYINSISYGLAILDAAVSAPIVLRDLSDDENPTLLAINAHPDAHLYEYLAVVYPPNRRGAGSGMAQPGRIDFAPPRSPNRTRARSRFRHDDPVGTWAMEVLHNVTDIGDYYNGLRHPERFDEMAAAAATHPSAYTKTEAGWLNAASVPVHAGGSRVFTLHAIGLSHPAPAGRVAAVKVPYGSRGRCLLVEARLRTDRWEHGFTGSRGLPSEGVVVYDFAPESDPWPRSDPNGPWPPLELRTPIALGVGESVSPAEANVDVRVESATAGGFVVRVVSHNVVVPWVMELRAATAAARVRTAGLTPKFIGESGSTAWVWRQSPRPGTAANPGSTVTLQTRTGPIP